MKPEELHEEIVKQGGSYEVGDFSMTLKDSMYIIKDNANADRIILQMNTDHHDFVYACKCVQTLDKRRNS
jgi:hypothetical protein